jgi:hypothetical protein
VYYVLRKHSYHYLHGEGHDIFSSIPRLSRPGAGSFQGVTNPALERDRRASLPPPCSPRLRACKERLRGNDVSISPLSFPPRIKRGINSGGNPEDLQLECLPRFSEPLLGNSKYENSINCRNGPGKNISPNRLYCDPSLSLRATVGSVAIYLFPMHYKIASQP